MRPDEKRLQALISTAFDAVSEPEAARLRELEERLVRRDSPRGKGSRMRFWWLFGALVVSGATAWWAGALWRPAEEAVTVPVETKSANDEEEPSSTEAKKEHRTESKQKHSPTIYRRERP